MKKWVRVRAPSCGKGKGVVVKKKKKKKGNQASSDITHTRGAEAISDEKKARISSLKKVHKEGWNCNTGCTPSIDVQLSTRNKAYFAQNLVARISFRRPPEHPKVKNVVP